MAGPIGHGVAKAMRDARNKGKMGGAGGPPWWVWALVAAALIAGMTWAALTLK